MSSRVRIILVGMGPTSESALAGLLNEFTVVALVRASSDGDGAIEMARRSGVQIETDTSIQALEDLIVRLRPDCVVVSSYDRILPARLVAEFPFVNVHYAPLPRYRGRATVNWAIINDEPCTAVSIHELLPGLDSGGILFQELVSIESRDNVTELYIRLNEIQKRALPGAVRRLLSGDHGTPQDQSKATYVCTRVPQDGEIDWTHSAVAIDRLVRALTSPFPGAFTWLDGKKVTINRAEPVDSVVWEGAVPGRVAGIDKRARHVDVFTGSGILRLYSITCDDRVMVPTVLVRSSRQTLGE